MNTTMTLDQEELQLVLDAVQLKLRYLKQNSWPTNALIEREQILKAYKDLETRLLDECGRDS